MRDRDEKREMDLRGHLEVSDELCEDGNQALLIVTADGDEYYVKNRRMIRKLQKYAFYDDIEIDFHGILKYDLDGLPVFSILNYVVPKGNVVEQDESNYSPKVKNTKRMRVEAEEEPEEELEVTDADFSDDDDFDDSSFEEDEEDDDGDK